MPTIFAIDGADYGFGEFGAYSSGVASLQTALITLGQKVGDSTLASLVLDGLIGPKTTAAANRAFTNYVSSGPNFASGGSMSQSQVASAAEELASFVRAEISRRGGTANSATAPVRVPAAATPTALSPYVPSSTPVSDSSAQIVKYAAIGLGGVVVASVLYMLWRRQQGRPAFGGGYDLGESKARERFRRAMESSLDRKTAAAYLRMLNKKGKGGLGALPRHDADAIESMMDRSGGVSEVFDTIGEIASGKADHVRENWNDERLARKWDGLARKMDKLASATKRFEVG